MDQRSWILKTEPHDYSFADLLRDGETVWDGVRAPAAIKNLWLMQPGQLALIYHTGKERAVVGVGQVASSPYPDPSTGAQRYPVVRVRAVSLLPSPVTLAKIKDSGLFPDWELVRLPRLSVIPVDESQMKTLMEWAGAGGVPPR